MKLLSANKASPIKTPHLKAKNSISLNKFFEFFFIYFFHLLFSQFQLKKFEIDFKKHFSATKTPQNQLNSTFLQRKLIYLFINHKILSWKTRENPNLRLHTHHSTRLLQFKLIQQWKFLHFHVTRHRFKLKTIQILKNNLTLKHNVKLRNLILELLHKLQR